MAIVAALTSCIVVVGVASAFAGGFNPFGDQQVSQTYANGILLPTNQWISPLGKRILDNDGTGGTGQLGARLVSSTISPDGQYLAALGWNNFQGFLTIVDLKTGTIVQQTRALRGRGDERRRSDGRRRRAAVHAGPVRRHRNPLGSAVGVSAEVQLQRQHRDRHPGGVDLSVRHPKRTSQLCILQRLRRRRRVRREPHRRAAGRRRGRASLRDGAVAGRYEAIRGTQRRQQARRDRHRQRHRARRDPGRQRAAPGRVGRQRHGRLRVERGRAAGQVE